MSKNAKIWTTIIIIIILVIIVWAVYAMTNSAGYQTPSQPYDNGYVASTTTTTTSTTTTDNSDASLNQDMNSVNTQMNGLGNDSTNANLGNGS